MRDWALGSSRPRPTPLKAQKDMPVATVFVKAKPMAMTPHTKQPAAITCALHAGGASHRTGNAWGRVAARVATS